MPEIPNYCKDDGGFSRCLAKGDWRSCHFRDKNTYIDRCLFSVRIDDDFIHCSCLAAQKEARQVKEK